MTARPPWDVPAPPKVQAIADQAGAAVAQTVAAAYSDGYAQGWLTCRSEMGERVAEYDRRALEMRIDLAGVQAQVAYLDAACKKLAPAAAQARTLAEALARAEGEVQALRREVAHLKQLAGLPEGM